MVNKKNRNPSVAAKSVAMKKPASFFAEQPPQKVEMAPARLHHLTRRDVLLFGAGALAALAGAGFLLPQETLRCASKHGLPWEGVVSEQSSAYR